MNKNLKYQEHKVSRLNRANAIGQGKFRGCTIWFTGLSGAGKSTIAFGVEEFLICRGFAAYTLDGDNIRHGLNRDLGFSESDREENIRRIAEVAALFADSGMIVISSFISPFRKDRESAKQLHQAAHVPFFECFVDSPLEVCESRDVKGLYRKARNGLIPSFTGISQPYEQPTEPQLVVKTDTASVRQCILAVVKMLVEQGLLEAHVLAEAIPNAPVQLFIEDQQAQLDKSLVNGDSKLPIINLTQVDLQWAQVLAEGWASPLRGFMREKEYLACLHFGQLQAGGRVHSQSIPIVLAIDDKTKENIATFKKVALYYQDKLIGRLDDIEVYPHRKRERCARVFGTLDERHPCITQIMASGNWLLGGDLILYERICWNDGLDQYRLTPSHVQAKLAEMGADAVFVFQLRNPVHNGHAMLMNDTRRMLIEKGYKHPVLLLHPLGGWTKDDDVPLQIRIKQHMAVLEEGILDAKNTLVSIFPSPMSYAGPREVQWHAKARLFTGAHFYIVGRDPAGINDPSSGEPLYEPMDGGKVLSMTPGLTQLQIIPFRVAAYDRTVGKMAFLDSNRINDFEFISGTKMRTLAREGKTPPNGFMGEKAWKVLADYYNDLKK